MNHILVTPERAAFLRQRLKEKFAERQAAKADFAAICERLATEPRLLSERSSRFLSVKFYQI